MSSPSHTAVLLPSSPGKPHVRKSLSLAVKAALALGMTVVLYLTYTIGFASYADLPNAKPGLELPDRLADMNFDSTFAARIEHLADKASAGHLPGLSRTSRALEKARLALSAHLESVRDHAARPKSEPAVASISAIPRIIHQIWGLFGDASPPLVLSRSIASFKEANPRHTHILWGPKDIDVFVEQSYPALWDLYRRLPLPVLKADLARYLVVLSFGGVYSDIDTIDLKPIDTWADNRANVTMIVGIEIDADGIADWQKYWGRKLQICQWTFAGSPNHPVLSNTVYRIQQQLQQRMVESLQQEEVTGVTGPSVFTDAVYDYIRAHGREWDELLGLRTAEQVGDLYVLTMTGFSPGVGHGSGTTSAPESKVQHLFSGSWTSQRPQHPSASKDGISS